MSGPLTSFTIKIPRNQIGRIRLTIPQEIRNQIGIVTYREGGKFPKLKTPILLIDIDGTKSISPVYLYRGQITIRRSSLAQRLDDAIRVDVIQIKSLIDSIFRTNKRTTKKCGKTFLDLYALIPPFTSGRCPIIVFSCVDGSLTVSYKTPSASPASMTIPRYIPFDQWTCQVFGLYITDGARSKNVHALGLTNNNPAILNLFLDFLEQRLGVPRSIIRAKITANRELHAGKDEELKKFWSEKLKLPTNQFYKTSFGKTATAAHGAVYLSVERCVLKEVFVSILEQVQDEIFSDPQCCKWTLQGIMAGDGFPQLEKSVLRRVVISVKERKDAIIYEKLLRQLNISFKWRKDRGIDITGAKNLCKLFSLNIFSLHNGRDKRFVDGFSKLRIAKCFQ